MALFSLCTVMVQAEELKFVTVLSQPIGAFAQVESLNEGRPSKTLFVNFCNKSVTTGKIDVQGMVKMNELRLTGDTARAGSSTVKMNYQITDADGLELGNKGSLSGGKLLAKTANPQDVTVAAGTNINASSTFIAADIPSMRIGGSTNIVYPAESLVGSNVHWEATTDEYRYNFKVDKDKGVIKDGTTEYKSYPIRTDKRGGECRCGNSRSPFGSRHCTNEWNTQTCSSQETPSARRVGTIFWRFNYETCQWYEADPKGYENTDNWLKWQKWGTIPSHHNCQCKGYTNGSYTDSSSTSWDQRYGNPRFKSGAINGNMVNETSATRTRLCQYDKIRGFGSKYDGNINERYDFNGCQWTLTSENCSCSTTSRGDYAPEAGHSRSGYYDRSRQCSSDSQWGSKYDGTITARYFYADCEWDEYYKENCGCSTTSRGNYAPEAGRTSGTSTKPRQCSSVNSKWTGTITDTYHYNTCSWTYGDNSSCKCANQPSNLTKEESCGSGYTGKKIYKYNTSLDKCTWELSSDTCEPEGCPNTMEKASCQKAPKAMWNESECGCRCCNKGFPVERDGMIWCEGDGAPNAAYLCLV